MIDMVQEYVAALESRLPLHHQARYTSRLCLGSAYKQNYFLDSTYMAKAMEYYVGVLDDLNKVGIDIIVPGVPPDDPNKQMASDIVKCDMLTNASELLAECCEEAGLYAKASEYYEVALKFARLLPANDRCEELKMKSDRVRNRMIDNGRPGREYISYLRTRIAQIEKKSGKTCPEALIEKEKLATALFDHGEFEEARRLAVATHSQCMRVFGPGHLRTKDIELLIVQISAKKESNAAQASTDEDITGAVASIAAMNLNESEGTTGASGTETGAKRRGKKKKGRRRRK